MRARGVMEKCTFCVQRIAQARILHDRDGTEEEVVTACQAACPTQAFTFGDIADPASDVARRKQSPLDYALLAEQNTRPRADLRGAHPQPQSGARRQRRAGMSTAPASALPVVDRRETVAGMTERVSGVPLRDGGWRWWWIALAASSSLLGLGVVGVGWAFYWRHPCLGQRLAGDVGLSYPGLCLVDRHRLRRHVRLGVLLPGPGRVARPRSTGWPRR